jgi:hypothetical protein
MKLKSEAFEVHFHLGSSIDNCFHLRVKVSNRLTWLLAHSTQLNVELILLSKYSHTSLTVSNRLNIILMESNEVLANQEIIR